MRTPSRYAPGTSPSGRCVRGTSSAVLCHRIRTGTPAQGRVDHLHHHTPLTVSKSPHNPGTQHSDHRTLCRAPDHTHAEQQQPDGNPPSRQADHTDHNDQATQSSSRWVRHRPGSLTIGSRSPLIIRDLDLYPQPPTNTRSPALNSEEPEKPAHRRGPQPLPASPDHGSVTHTQRGRVTMTDEEPFVEAYRQGC